MKEKRFELKEVEAYTIEEIKASLGSGTTPLVANKRTVEVSICGKINYKVNVDFETEEPRYSVAELEKIVEKQQWGELSEKDKEIVIGFFGYISRNRKVVEEILK